MTVRRTLYAIALGTAVLALAGCMGGEDDDASLADYTPKYTEAKGAQYGEDYFPLAPAAPRPLTGAVSGSMRVQMTATGNGERFSQDTTMPLDAVMQGTTEILPETVVELASGPQTVVPMVTRTSSTGGEGPVEPGENGTTYYQKRDDGIHELASFSDEDGLEENTVTLYLRLPMVVGESWDAPMGDMADLAGAGDEVSATSRIHVVGKETVTAGGKSIAALRLEQVVLLSGTVIDEETGMPIKVSGEFHGIVHLAQGIGQVKQSMSGKVNSSGTMNEDGMTVKVNMTMDMQADMALAPGALAKSSSASAGSVPADLFAQQVKGALRASVRAAAAAVPVR